MKKVLSIILASLGLALYSCQKERVAGSGPIVSEAKAVSGFTGIIAKGDIKVTITQANDFSVQVKDYQNLLPYFEANLTGTDLRLGFKDNAHISNSQMQVNITMPELQSIQIEGSGQVNTAGNFSSTPIFTASIEGSGIINIEQAAAVVFDTRITGSGHIKAFGMVAAEGFTNTTGSGNTELTATQKLRSAITGSGNVYYKGSPQVSVQISGSGKVLPY